MKVAIIGDSHFDEHSRFAECIRLHDWIADDARARGVDVVLHAGDVFERKSTPAERNAFASWVRRIADFAPLVIVRGNHDAVGDLAIFASLDTSKTVIVEEAADCHAVCTDAGELVIGCLAWPRKAELVASGAFGDDEGAAGRALRAVLSGFRDEFESVERLPRILLTHAMVRGSMTSVGQPLVGMEMELGLEDLALAGADFIALGHIHMPQDWDAAGVPAVYPGSPRRTTFGEVEDKGYIVATFDGPKLVGWERVVVPATPMYLADARVDADGNRGHVTGLPDEIPAGAEVRFRVHGPASQREKIREIGRDATALLTQVGAVVKVEEVITAETRARAPEVAKAATLADKLSAFWASKGIPITGERLARLVSKANKLEGASL